MFNIKELEDQVLALDKIVEEKTKRNERLRSILHPDVINELHDMGVLDEILSPYHHLLDELQKDKKK